MSRRTEEGALELTRRQSGWRGANWERHEGRAAAGKQKARLGGPGLWVGADGGQRGVGRMDEQSVIHPTRLFHLV